MNRNVCLINDSFPPVIDGVANAVINYGKVIEKVGGHSVVVTPYYPDADDSKYPFPVYRYPSIDTTKFIGYRGGVPLSYELIKELEKEKLDLIHCHCPMTSMMLSRVLRDYIQKPIVFTYHTKFDIDIANAVKSRLLQEATAKIIVHNISAADEVWTVSKGAGENLRALGYEGEYIVMPNGVDMPKGRVEDKLISDVSGDYYIPEGIPVYLFVGRMMWYKGLKITIDALAALKFAGYDFRMLFIGGGGNFEEVKSYVRGLKLEDKIVFTGPIREREKLRALYCRADLFLFPSTFDTNGLVVREAAACGLASILVDGSCAGEDVTNFRNGFLIQENAASMAATLVKLQEHPEVIKRAGEKAQNELYLSWDRAVENAMERYEVVIENHKSKSYHHKTKLAAEFYRPFGEALDEFSRIQKRVDGVLESIISQHDEDKDIWNNRWNV